MEIESKATRLAKQKAWKFKRIAGHQWDAKGRKAVKPDAGRDAERARVLANYMAKRNLT